MACRNGLGKVSAGEDRGDERETCVGLPLCSRGLQSMKEQYRFGCTG